MRRRCQKGKSCGSSCISRHKVCQIELKRLKNSLSEARDEMQAVPPRRPVMPAAVPEVAPKRVPKPIFRISPESRQAAAEAIAKYTEKEPATTSLMARLAEKNGMELLGLRSNLKTETSLARKIEISKHEFGGDARKTAQSISDINRYTMQVPAGNYGKSVKNTLAELESQGYQLRIKNYWSKDAGPYRGMNIALTAPDGRKIELQFHTKESLEVKNKTHSDYKEFRISKDNARRRVLWDRMVEMAKTIPIPEGALEIGGPEAIIKRQFEPI